MRVQFDKLVIGPYRAYREPYELDLREMGLGVWFVSGENRVNEELGSNGAAKSTIWDCLVWTLYGRTIKNRPTTAVKPWAVKAPPEGKVYVEVDGVQHVIHRKGVTNGLWLNDKVVVQETIDKLIGMSREIFLYTIVHGQGREFFLDLKPAAKMDVMSEAFNLSRWDTHISNARKLAQKHDMEAERAMAEVGVLKRQIEEHEKKFDEHTARAREWDEDDADRGDKLRKEIKQLEKEHKHVSTELGKADLAYDGAETELRHTQVKIQEASAKRAPLSDALAKCRAHEHAIKQDIDREKKARANLKVSARCPVCSQVMSAKHVQQEQRNIDATLDRLSKALRRAEDDTDAASARLAKLDKQIDAYRVDERAFREKSNKAIDDRTHYQSRTNETRFKLESKIKEEAAPPSNPYSPLVAEVRKQLGKLESALNKTESAVRDAQEDRDLAKYWIEGFKNLRLYLIEDALAELESAVQSELASVGLDGWRIEFDVEKETKKGTTPGLSTYVYQPEYDSSLPWEDFSGGEGQRLQLTTSVALSKVLLGRAGVECDLIVLDEPTRHMSPEGLRDVSRFLTELGQDRQVIYVDHAAIDSRRFAGTIWVIRDEKGARLGVRA